MTVRRLVTRGIAVVCAVAVAPVGAAAAAVSCPAPLFLEPSPPTSAECVARAGVQCYSPAQMEQAYGLKPLYRRGYDGRGRTIIIVDPYGSPTIGTDLAHSTRRPAYRPRRISV